MAKFIATKTELNKITPEISALLNKHNVDNEFFIRRILRADVLTKKELSDIEYVEDRLIVHLEVK